MKRFAGLAFLAAVTVLLLLFITNPKLLDKVWIWMVGLAGYVLILLENGYKKLTQVFGNKNLTDEVDGSDTAPQNLQSQLKKIEGRIVQLEKQLGQSEGPPKSPMTK